MARRRARAHRPVAFWQLPLFWIASGLASTPLYVVPGWLLGLASGAVVLGWLYERSSSILVVALAHTAATRSVARVAAKGSSPQPCPPPSSPQRWRCCAQTVDRTRAQATPLQRRSVSQ